MNDFWVSMGFIRYPMFVTCLIILAVTAWCAARLLRPGARADGPTKAWVDAILFWGGFGLITGVLGTLVGIVLTAASVEAAGGSATAPLIWGGVKVALGSSVFGLLIVALSSLVWFGLQIRWKLLEARAVT